MYGLEGHGSVMITSWLFIIFLIGTVFYYITRSQKEDSSAKETLDKRYADGKIDTEEYKKRLKMLETRSGDNT